MQKTNIKNITASAGFYKGGTNKKSKIKKTADFLFEAAALKRLKRTGWQILGGNDESIAEHSFMVAVISCVLAMELKADEKKTLVMALFHDFSEARIGDVYRLAGLYVRKDEKKAALDAFDNLPAGESFVKMYDEYKMGKSLEAKIVHDADVLSLGIELKQLIEEGSLNAKEWYNANLKRLKLVKSKEIAEKISRGNSQDWWKKERNEIHKEFSKD